MKTRTSMLSSLAIAALATVTLNSTEALAKSGGGGGGMRSFSAARTSPVVVTRVKTFSAPSVKKLTTSKLSTTVVRDHRLKPAFLSGKKITLNPQPLHPAGVIGPLAPLPPKNPPAPPAPPPVVDHPHSHPSVSVGLGVVAAPVAVDPPGCVYERSVRKLPGGGLQRVIVKVCPDVIVQ